MNSNPKRRPFGGMKPASGKNVKGNRPSPKAEAKSTENQKVDELIGQASETTGTDSEKLKEAIASGKLDSLTSKMKPNEAAKLNEILSDEEKLKKMLETPQAQALMKKFLG